LQGEGGQPDCLLLSHLPFAEDMRYARFPSFADKQELVPSQQQLERMRGLVSRLHMPGAPPAALFPMDNGQSRVG
jgi:hypothetical protein